MSHARIGRILAIVEAKEAEQVEQAKQAERVQVAREAERNPEPIAPPNLSGGLDPMGIGDDDRSELAEWYRSVSGAASRKPGIGSMYFPSTRGAEQ
ncbi:hypothetical protein C7C45_04835 [Micromonospora arborensis]|uniref:Uncharacterized protein n=1 Tax=Micromonospora arborensis TaxID=2116518 RepID=A0A318NPA6_9ACTN|nr:hypothetical protein [Micromonospora arborensis]PYC75197.1 hypothetical protein C7C45_04835 [Micromonospora arborensis]